MTIDGDAAYQVLLAHDARFDGRLFVGVTSTGIYCRPICRVRMPARRNCRFFASPAQAEAASFRPCMKCRPEIAPGPGLPWTVMDASRTLARQAASALDEFAAEADAPSVAKVAARLGVSDRHLRRIFFAEHGVTPLQYLQTRRLLLAKQLLTDTQMPIAQIALTSGFRSLRRFNAAFLGGYRMNPTRLRRSVPRETTASAAKARLPSAARTAGGGDAITVTLGYRAPYDV
jgi:AraC family transcriptional regulator of adaptative response / DNA-3-methyladenine glycosylase II